jgi:hypothetical protein
MSSRTFTTVQKVFMDEVERTFGFLTSEFGLAGPERVEVVLPVVTYAGPGFGYKMMLDSDDMTLFTQVNVDVEDGHLTAGLSELVFAAKLGTGHEVRCSAHNLYNLQKALESQASFVRRLHPLMNTDTTIELMKKAGARKWLKY